MQHAVKIRRARMRLPDSELHCDRLRGFGFVVECSCGERSRVLAGYPAARAWAAEHVKMGEVAH